MSNEAELLKQIGYTKHKKHFDALLLRIPYYYNKVKIPKKDGGERILFVPDESLKEIQGLILKEMLEKIKLPECVFGGVKNKSIIENALRHSKNKYLINIDIKNFFPSVHHTLVNKLFLDLGSDKCIVDILTKLTTFNYCLPQGAPTSPYLANLVLNNLDYRLYNFSKKFGVTYTRYFDDLSLSGDSKVIDLKNDFIKIVIEEGYKIKIEKIKEFKHGQTKEITGILINKTGELSLKKRDDLEKYLRNIHEQGIRALSSDNIKKEELSASSKINFINKINKKDGCHLEKLFNKIDWQNLKY